MEKKMKEKHNHHSHSPNSSKGGHSHHDHHKHMMEDFKKRFIVSTLLTIPILLISPGFMEIIGLKAIYENTLLLIILSSAVYFYGGKPFLEGSIKELKKKSPGMMTLIALAITTSYLYSIAVSLGLEGKTFFWELTTLISIMLLGHWIEMKSVLGASKALEELVKLLPSKAHLIKGGKIIDVPIEKLKVGDVVLVKAGEKIPADGRVVKGETYVNESLLTGESKPVKKAKGDEVIGGSINGIGVIEVEITKVGKDSFLSQVIEMVKRAQETKSRTQDLANKAAFILTIIAITSSLITFIAWRFFLNQTTTFALERAVTLMVITCPHALGLAIPLVVAISTSLSARKGILIRNRLAFENAKDLEYILFDKTGTLTEGEFKVSDVVELGNIKREEILKIASSIEKKSEHPIGKAIAQYKGNLKVVDFKVIPGKGVKAKVNGKEVEIASKNYFEEEGIKVKNKKVEELFKQGKTVVLMAIQGKLVGAIALSDKIKEDARESIKKLKEMGIKCIMLTGDNEKVARYVANELGIEYYAELLPQEKLKKIEEFQKKAKGKVAMVGDGINDAPALAKADVGIAIGAGTNVAIESGDIILVRNNLRGIVELIKIAKSTYRKMIENLAWATGYNVIAIPLAGGVLYYQGILLSPAIAALLMSLSTVIVAINAQLLKREG